MALFTVHFVRHGEVDNPEGILYGRLPGYGLTEVGVRMAISAADYLRSLADEGAVFSHVAASPLMRTQQTAAPIAQALQVDLLTDENLIETRSHFEGLPAVPRAFFTWRHLPYLHNPFRPSWGEPYAETVARMKQAIETARGQALARKGAGAHAVLVSHQAPIWLLRQALGGKRLLHDPRRRQCALGSVTTFHFEDEHLTGTQYYEPTPAASAAMGA